MARKKYEDNFINSLDKDFIWKAKAAVRIKKKGRAKGGQLIGIRKTLGKNVTIHEWKYGVSIEGDLLEMEDKKLKIITVYNNEGVSNVNNQIKPLLEDVIEKGEGLIVLGDWNARIGCENGEAESDSYEIERNYTKNRTSEDKMSNPEGRKLLNLCIKYGLKILNGCIKDDYEGKLTYIGEAGSLVLDYIIIKVDEGENPIKSVKIETRVESDHLLVTFQMHLKRERENNSRNKRIKKKLIGEKLIWDESKEKNTMKS